MNSPLLCVRCWVSLLTSWLQGPPGARICKEHIIVPSVWTQVKAQGLKHTKLKGRLQEEFQRIPGTSTVFPIPAQKISKNQRSCCHDKNCYVICILYCKIYHILICHLLLPILFHCWMEEVYSLLGDVIPTIKISEAELNMLKDKGTIYISLSLSLSLYITIELEGYCDKKVSGI